MDYMMFQHVSDKVGHGVNKHAQSDARLDFDALVFYTIRHDIGSVMAQVLA